MEMAMDLLKRNWWIGVAAAMAAMQTTFGFGNLVEDDGGAMPGRLIAFAIMVVGAALIVVGIAARQLGRTHGGALVGVGVLPSALGIAFLWFPPAVAYGILAILVAAIAFRDAYVTQAAARLT